MWGCGLFPIMHCVFPAEMASNGESVLALEDQEERKPAAVSFGFTKTISKFKNSGADVSSNKDEKEYLTGIDKRLLQRYESDANANRRDVSAGLTHVINSPM